jgi:hypothetical protein
MHPDTRAYHAALVPEDRYAAIAKVDPVAPWRRSGQAGVIQRGCANSARPTGRSERLA